MGLFDFLFKNKEEEEKEDKIMKQLGNIKINPENNAINPCDFCGFTIESHQPIKKIMDQGKKIKFHRKCFKKAKQLAMKKRLGQL